MSLFPRNHQFVEDSDLLVEKTLTAVALVILVVLVCPGPSYSVAKLRTCRPEFTSDLPNIHLKDSRVISVDDQHHITVVSIFQRDKLK